jgi:opacity protein-like surface antigen
MIGLRPLEQARGFWPNVELGLSFMNVGAFSRSGTGTYLPSGTAMYNFKYRVASRALWFTSRWTIYQQDQWQVFANANLGFAQNKTSGYEQTALPGFSQYANYAFGGKTNTGLAYALGLGAGYRIDAKWQVRLAYNYQNLGKEQLGASSSLQPTTSPATTLLNNAFSLSLSYKFK